MVDELEPCEDCEKSKTGICDYCYQDSMTYLAKMTVFQHLLASLGSLFEFDFFGVCFELVWAFQRLTRTGDYGKGGEFERMGIDWRTPNEY